MCWNLQVTLVAASLETACLAVLCCRRRRNDCRNASLLLPLLLQEWLQALLWAHIGSSPTECDEINQLGSTAVTYVICGVPAWMCLQPLLRRDELSAEQRGVAKSFLGIACLCGTGGALVQIVGRATGWMTSICTYPGPWHHQVWPVLNIQFDFLPGLLGSLLGDCLSAGNLALYMAASLGGFLCPVPSYVLPALAAVGLNAQLLILFLGREWGSFWCFQASLLQVVALLEPWLLECFEPPAFLTSSWAADKPCDARDQQLPRAEGSEDPVAPDVVGAADEMDPLVP